MSDLLLITKCLLCAQEFTQGPRLIGEDSAARAQRMYNGLKNHIEKRHPNEFQAIIQRGQSFSSYLTLCQFEFQDAWHIQFRESIRHGFFKGVQRFTVSDQLLVQRVTALQLPDEYSLRVLTSHQAMRNILQEDPAPAGQAVAADPPNWAFSSS